MRSVRLAALPTLVVLTAVGSAGCGGISTREVPSIGAAGAPEGATGGSGASRGGGAGGPSDNAGALATGVAGGALATGGAATGATSGGAPATGGAPGASGNVGGIGGNPCPTGEQCALPSGACRSQTDCGGDRYAAFVFCRPTRCDAPEGVCTVFPGGCGQMSAPVCGCDGTSYPNSCYADFQGVGIDYTGMCRCSSDRPCAPPELCVLESCTSPPCPRVCVRP